MKVAKKKKNINLMKLLNFSVNGKYKKSKNPNNFNIVIIIEIDWEVSIEFKIKTKINDSIPNKKIISDFNEDLIKP